MFFKLKGNHQGANPSLCRKYGPELLMWAGVIWQRKIVFGKFRHKRAQKNDEIIHLLIGQWNVLKNAFWAITPTPRLPQSKPLYPHVVHGSVLNTCFALCRRNAHFLSRCAGEMHTSWTPA